MLGDGRAGRRHGLQCLDLRLLGGRQDRHGAEAAKYGGYSTTDYDASFVGFFPAQDPQVEVMVVVDSPRTSHFGGVVAAPAFEQIGTWLANYLAHPPGPALRPQRSLRVRARMQLGALIEAVRPRAVRGRRRRRSLESPTAPTRVVPGALHVCVPRAHRGRARLRPGGRPPRRRRARRASATCRSTSRSWSSSRRAGRWPPPLTPSSGAPRPRSTWWASPGRTARRRRRSWSTPSSRRPAATSGLLGTVEQRVGGRVEPVGADDARERRSPGAPAPDGDAGDTACVMEVSSHALELERVAGVAIRRSRVHQPHAGPPRLPSGHGALLPRPRRGSSTAAPAAINVDDPYGRRLAGEAGGRGPHLRPRRPGRRCPRARGRDRRRRRHLADRATPRGPLPLDVRAARRVQRRERAVRGRRSAEPLELPHDAVRAGPRRRRGCARAVRAGRRRPALHRAGGLRPHAGRAREPAARRRARSPPGT